MPIRSRSNAISISQHSPNPHLSSVITLPMKQFQDVNWRWHLGEGVDWASALRRTHKAETVATGNGAGSADQIQIQVPHGPDLDLSSGPAGCPWPVATCVTAMRLQRREEPETGLARLVWPGGPCLGSLSAASCRGLCVFRLLSLELSV